MTTNVQNVAAIYCRISQDRQGRGEGVETQERWGRAYADEHWPDLPVRVYADNDVTAAKEDARRPAFDQLREDIRAGRVARLWTVEQSRLTRVETVWFQLVAELLRAGVKEVHTNRDGVIRLGDVVGGIKAVLAAHETARMRERIMDKLDELAQDGRPVGFGGFGYRHTDLESHRRLRAWQARQHDAKRRGVDLEQWRRSNPRPPTPPLVDEKGRTTIAVVEDEADAIRTAAERVLSGWTLAAVARELDAKGFRGGRGGTFVGGSVIRMLSRPKIAGLREHRGTIVGKGKWEWIIDEAIWRAVNAVLDQPRTWTDGDGVTRTIHPDRPNARKGARRRYLLSGIATCGTCGEPLTGAIDRRPDWPRVMYRCLPVRRVAEPNARPTARPKAKPAGKPCVAITTDVLDEYVCERLFKQLTKPEFLAALAEEDHSRRDEITNELRRIDARRGELGDMWNAEILTSEQFRRMNDEERAKAAALSAELAELPPPVGGVDPAEVAAMWPHMDLESQRATIAKYVASIVLHNRPRAEVTSDDVAALAGVSRSMVSRVLKHDYGSEKTRAIVKEAADKLGYHTPAQPNVASAEGRVTIEWRDSR